MSGKPIQNELAAAATLFNELFSDGATLPISFIYGGIQSSDLLPQWKMDASSSQLKFTDPDTGLQLRVEATLYEDYPVVEWVAYFKNTGDKDTPIISNIQALDWKCPTVKEEPCTVHYAKGSLCRTDDFQPQLGELPLGGNVTFETLLGRSSNGVLPYFNLHTGKNGVIGAIGWTGGWKATFARDIEGVVNLTAGLVKTNLTLHPGEEIRTPRIVLLLWEGESIHGHNMLRSFTLAHHSPMRNGKLARVPICDAVWGENTTEKQLAKIEWWKTKDFKLDCFWIDAGWYGNGKFLPDSTVFNSEWPIHVGNWWPNKACYPNGLKPIGDAVKEADMDFLLWFEPERCFRGTYFCAEHPEWLYGDKEEEWAGGSRLLNLGNPEAREYVTDLISNIITEAGLTWYRQDFNIDPGKFWEDADAPDRVGMSEIRHIEGLYKMWDDLRDRHPGLMIDNCSSGGRRIDLEMNTRSIPLWRSDYQCFPEYDAIGMQGQTHGLGMWVPLSSGNCDRPDDYCFRSALGQGIVLTPTIGSPDPVPDTFPLDWMKKMFDQFETVRDCCTGDFYPLLSFSLEKDAWAAWQFDRPDERDGVIAAFRRQESPFPKMETKLKGLLPESVYELKDLDTGIVTTYTGSELMTNGFELTISNQPGSVLISYKRK